MTDTTCICGGAIVFDDLSEDWICSYCGRRLIAIDDSDERCAEADTTPMPEPRRREPMLEDMGAGPILTVAVVAILGVLGTLAAFVWAVRG